MFSKTCCQNVPFTSLNVCLDVLTFDFCLFLRHYSHPHTPDIPGIENFKGTVHFDMNEIINEYCVEIAIFAI